MYDYAYLFVIILWNYKTKLFCINYLMPAPLIANRQSCYNILIEILSLIQCGSGKSILKLNEVSYCILACVYSCIYICAMLVQEAIKRTLMYLYINQ